MIFWTAVCGICLSFGGAAAQAPGCGQNFTCDDYSVTETVAGKYEVREYPSNKMIVSEDDDAELKTLGSYVLSYLNGDNSDGDTLTLTAPCRGVFSLDDTGAHFDSTLWLQLAEDNPPAPQDERLTLTEDDESRSFYVRSFTALYTKERIYEEAQALLADLPEDAASDDTEVQYAFYSMGDWSEPIYSEIMIELD